MRFQSYDIVNVMKAEDCSDKQANLFRVHGDDRGALPSREAYNAKTTLQFPSSSLLS